MKNVPSTIAAENPKSAQKLQMQEHSYPAGIKTYLNWILVIIFDNN